MRYSTEYWPKVFRRCITNSNVWTKVLLKDMLKTFDDFRKRQKSFWYVKVRVFRECIQYTIYWDKTHFFKKLPSDKKMVQIMSFFRVLQLVTVLFLICGCYMSWSVRFISLKLCVGCSVFNFVSFLFKFIFLFNKMNGLFDFKTS